MRYEAPTTVAAATGLLAANAGTAHVLAGGTDLLVKLRAGVCEPGLVVDIKRIDGMRCIRQEAAGWRIGAAVSGAEMSEHAGLVRDRPGLVEGMDLIGSTQIQGRATLAGNLCNASPAADSVPAMAAAGAIARIAGPDGQRDLAVADIPLAPGKTCLKQGEFITSILLPAKPPRSGDAYLRFTPRSEMDIAVVGCGVFLSLNADGTCREARIALGAVGPTVLLVTEAAKALTGTKITGTDLDTLAAICSNAATPIDDKRGTVAFRKHVAGVLARRAAKTALSRCVHSGSGSASNTGQKQKG